MYYEDLKYSIHGLRVCIPEVPSDFALPCSAGKELNKATCVFSKSLLCLREAHRDTGAPGQLALRSSIALTLVN